MKILRLLNKKNFSITLITLITLMSFTVQAEDQPVDIWNINKNELEEKQITNETNLNNDIEIKVKNETDIYNMQSQNKYDTIKLDENLKTEEVSIYGLYDPEDYDLDINMWSNSNGNQLKSIFTRLDKIDLSEDANEIMKIVLLTNAYFPSLDISNEEFLI